MNDARIEAPATQRNREPILAVLRTVLPASGLLLEIASGSGEHAVHFAQALPGLEFQPTDPDAARRASIDAWAAESGLANIRPALALDAAAPSWPVAHSNAVLCCNMIHIAPWTAAVGLIAGAARVLPAAGALILYGPYRQGGAHTAPSNAEFDASLRARDPRWGIRDLEAIAALAAQAGFGGPAITEMPANNLCLVFRKV
jgi:hypothetical protein